MFFQDDEPSPLSGDKVDGEGSKKRKEPEPLNDPLPKQCPACKKVKALERWKEKNDAYEKGEGAHPGQKPAPVKKAHVKDCPGYKRRGSGPRRKDDETEVCVRCAPQYVQSSA
jgi:hypothetical protein